MNRFVKGTTKNTNTEPSNHLFAGGTVWGSPIKPSLLGLKGLSANIEFIKTVTIRDV